MRIVVNDIAVDAGGGMTLLRQLYQHILTSGDTNEWFFLLGDRHIQPTDKIHVLLFPKVKASRLRRLLFDLFTGRKVINALSPDVVFYLQNTLVQGVKTPQVVYMDQSIPFQQEKRFSFLKREERPYAVYQHLIGRLIRSACKRARRVIVQTQWMKDAVARCCGVKADRIIKIPPEFTMDPKWQNSCNQVDTNRFFYPASGAVYKDHDCLYKAISCLQGDAKVLLTLPSSETKAGCIGAGQMPVEEVYRNLQSATLVFPSYIESYGLPLLEARRIGSLILAADTAFAREVLADYPNAYFFPKSDSAALASLMENVMDGKICRVPHTESSDGSSGSGWLQVIKILEEARDDEQESHSSVLP